MWQDKDQEKPNGNDEANLGEIPDADLDKISGGVVIDTTDEGLKPGPKIGEFISKVGK